MRIDLNTFFIIYLFHEWIFDNISARVMEKKLKNNEYDRRDNMSTMIMNMSCRKTIICRWRCSAEAEWRWCKTLVSSFYLHPPWLDGWKILEWIEKLLGHGANAFTSIFHILLEHVPLIKSIFDAQSGESGHHSLISLKTSFISIFTK